MHGNDSNIDNNVGPSLDEQFLVYDPHSKKLLRLRNKKATIDGKNALGKNKNDITVARDGICVEWETEKTLWERLTPEQRMGFDHAVYPDNKLYFLKTPTDTIEEYFAEGLAGLMVEGMFEKNILDASYRKCFSPAIPVIVGTPENPESFSLLQHCAPQGYQEMYKLKNPTQQKKNNMKEWLARRRGRGYEYILDAGRPFGFSYAFMMETIICCNFSVHSANWMVRKRNDKLEAMLIDYGAAFRSIGSAKYVLEQNNKNPMISLEEGERVFTTFKKYNRYLKTIPRFYQSVKKHTNNFLNKLKDDKQKLEDLRTLYETSTIYMLNMTKQKVKHKGNSWLKERENIMRYIYGEHWSYKTHDFDLNKCLKDLKTQNTQWPEKRADIIRYLYLKYETKNAEKWIMSCLSIIQTESEDVWKMTEEPKIEQYLLNYFDKTIAKSFKEELEKLATMKEQEMKLKLKHLIQHLTQASLIKRIKKINREEPITRSTTKDNIEENQDKYAALLMARICYKAGMMRATATKKWKPQNGWDDSNKEQDGYQSATPSPPPSPKGNNGNFFSDLPISSELTSYALISSSSELTGHASISSSSSGLTSHTSISSSSHLSCKTDIDSPSRDVNGSEHDDDLMACTEEVLASPHHCSSSFQRHVNKLLGQLCDGGVFTSNTVDKRLSCVPDREYLRIGVYAADNPHISKKTIAWLIMDLAKEKDGLESLIELYNVLQAPASDSDPEFSLFDMFISGLKHRLVNDNLAAVYDGLIIMCVTEILCLWEVQKNDDNYAELNMFIAGLAAKLIQIKTTYNALVSMNETQILWEVQQKKKEGNNDATDDEEKCDTVSNLPIGRTLMFFKKPSLSVVVNKENEEEDSKLSHHVG